MVPAEILAAQTADQCGTQTCDELSPCIQQLPPADRDYYRLRADEEAAAAQAAICCEARLAHEDLAAAYRKLCSSNGGRDNIHLASELSAFLFNPKPTD